MRILFLTPSSRLLGARQSLLDLASNLPAGAEPLVVCPNRGELWEKLNERGVPTEVIRHHPWRKAGGWMGARLFQVPELKRLIRGFAPDIVHGNEFHSLPQGVRAAYGSPARVTGHVRLSITPRQIENYSLAGCHRIICVSRAVEDLFEGTPLEAKTRVVYNGIALENFAPGPRTPISVTAGWPETAMVCGLLGLVSERKNQLLAAEAVAIANTRGADVRLLLAGDPFKSSMEYGDRVRARICAHDLAGRVAWLPFQKAVRPLYGAIDLNLLISNEEGFGRTIIEAGAMGIPSVGSAMGGIPELILDGETGWIVRELTAERLAGVLVAAWTQREEVRKRGEAARKRVGEHFTLEACVRNTMAVWGE